MAKQMARCISDVGGDPFIDIFDVKKGDRIERKIQAELPSCKELVVLLTPGPHVEIGSGRRLVRHGAAECARLAYFTD